MSEYENALLSGKLRLFFLISCASAKSSCSPRKGLTQTKKKNKRRENKWAQGEHGFSQNKVKVFSQKGKRHLLLGGLQDCQKTCAKYILKPEAKKTRADE